MGFAESFHTTQNNLMAVRGNEGIQGYITLVVEKHACSGATVPIIKVLSCLKCYLLLQSLFTSLSSTFNKSFQIHVVPE